MPKKKAFPRAMKRHLSEFKTLPDNPNKGTVKGRALIEESIEHVGFARPIVAARDGTILAGNHVAEVLSEKGMEDVVIVETDGSRPIIHVRTDVKAGSEEAFQIAVADNETSARNYALDIDLIAGEASRGKDVSWMFSAEWLKQNLGAKDPLDVDDEPAIGAPLDVPESQTRMVQLFFDGPGHEQFIKQCVELRDRFGTENITDTVEAAVRYAYDHSPS